ncbi:MAG: hypothetical protein CMO81_07445 [Waddliaceae bacterium]|nr:hypothetical protein [Waddliaceae bacterium]
MSFAFGLILGTLIARDSSYSYTPRIWRTWYNDDLFRSRLAEMNKGWITECPATFYQDGKKVQVATDLTLSDDRSIRRAAPDGHQWYQDFVGHADSSRGQCPSPQRCEEAVDKFLRLKKEGIKTAKISTILGPKVIVRTRDGRKEEIPL